ncbi:MAG: hypothetical protein KC910_31220 [Candidatus Eremiobacteraeota bacterium]|nr:hypothetical protein [Candidatus Eremiobacteraeota bacterium]
MAGLALIGNPQRPGSLERLRGIKSLVACDATTPGGPRDGVSATVISTRLGLAYHDVAAADERVHVPDARLVKSTDDYTRFLSRLENKYPDADALDLNRAVRQHFYGDQGKRNQMGVFDSWLGDYGGNRLASLKGIEEDLQGLPDQLRRPDGKSVNLAHLAAGIDTHYQINKGMASRHNPVQWLKGAALTHAGDLGQTFGGLVRAVIPGVGDKDETISKALGYSSLDQLRGNQAGIEMGASLGPGEKLSAATRRYFGN